MSNLSDDLIEHRLNGVEKDVDMLTKNVNDLTLSITKLTTSLAAVKWISMIAGSSIILRLVEMLW